MRSARYFLASLGLFFVVLSTAGCTTRPVNAASAAKIKSLTVTRLYLPEYSYLGLDGEAAAKSLGTVAGYAALGVIGFAAADAIRTKSEQPYRDAIRDALEGYEPTFAQAVSRAVESELSSRGVSVTPIPPPPRLADNTGYDYSGADFNSDALLELFPVRVGFSVQNQEAAPIIDIRWRILVRYPNGKLIETNRGSVVYTNAKLVFGQSGEPIPPNPAYAFKGHVTELKAYGDKPHRALQDLATSVSRLIVDRAYPVPAASK